ncbi:nuclear transport factor 2 family protein [Mycobacterium sp.]|uniref:nuclear transport factor 2 family protein n=1 Tax=Mycobacterium sp. TaxID=1785 RepID=UPI0025F4B336|nr:nuclear transport factor 2 family protein [Mycobacterium sp.]
MTQQFVAALDELHHRREVDALVELFADDATLDKVGMPRGEEGKDGARAFWEQYRAVFDDIEASFRHRVDGDDIAFLEWTSKGTLRDGTAFSYDGVSVLESNGDTINAFRTYYDTAAFMHERKATSS